MSTVEANRRHQRIDLPASAPRGLDRPGRLRRAMGYATVGPTGSIARQAATTVGLVVGAALVATTGAIHLDLWATGYRNIPTIGPLFLFQGVGAVGLAILLVGLRRLFAVVAAAGFMIATIVGFLLSIYVGLFGFMDTLAAPFAGEALAFEIAGVVVLTLLGIVLLVGHTRSSTPGAMPGTMEVHSF